MTESFYNENSELLFKSLQLHLDVAVVYSIETWLWEQGDKTFSPQKLKVNS